LINSHTRQPCSAGWRIASLPHDFGGRQGSGLGEQRGIIKEKDLPALRLRDVKSGRSSEKY